MSNKTNEIYQEVTDRIIGILKAGATPWRKTWSGKGPQNAFRVRNYVTDKPYRGINVLLLASAAMEKNYSSPFWMTYKQAKGAGAQVRRGEKGTQIVFWNFFEKEDETSGDKKTIPFLRRFSVFNADQIDGLPDNAFPKAEETKSTFEVLADCEAICNGYEVASLSFGGDRAYYQPALDHIQLPHKEDFESPEAYYTTRFHEMAHSTGHKDRLARPGITDIKGFGSHEYSREELVAELTAAFLSAEAGISTKTVENSAAYLNSWIKALEEDNKMVIWASSRAQAAADLILGRRE